ncbi:efflux RND transporter periplasmic adaptor subunit [Petroclostridium sp. X23]|uniref:efflux RND transporter periplasmic adaptor subunit n=1 Tax=Petroclostridium sp. X23 TaxID=3045146 RepID=UPI0024ACBB14|nr:efflux RND transporter periplasmic adaptor subunit [Petroclostridium sp. X23]WHH58698.1 efflux RND transporter periplasmic adaptor subunit [Petroclostridium sp. X23]
MLIKKHFIVFIALLALLSGCSDDKSTMKSEKEVPVEVLNVQAASYDKKITLPGVISNDEEIVYSFKMEGKIEKILVKSGQKVKAGDVLAKLDENDYKKILEISELQIKSAKAALDNAEKSLEKAEFGFENTRKDFENTKVLYEAGAISKNEYENTELRFNIAAKDYDISRGGAIDLAKSKYDSAVASHEMMKTQFVDGELRSSIDGYVKEIFVKEGNQVSKNDPVIAVGSTNVQVTIGISADEKQNIQLNDKVDILYDSKVIYGYIASVSDVLDSKTLLYKAEVSIPDNNIPLYSIVKVEVNIGERKAIKVPVNAVLNDGEPFVFVVENDHAVKRRVSIIGYDKEYVFLEGVSDDEKVVIVGNKVLRGGERVVINQ